MFELLHVDSRVVIENNQGGTVSVVDQKHTILSDVHLGARFGIYFLVDLQVRSLVPNNAGSEVALPHDTLWIDSCPDASSVISACDCSIAEVNDLVPIL